MTISLKIKEKYTSPDNKLNFRVSGKIIKWDYFYSVEKTNWEMSLSVIFKNGNVSSTWGPSDPQFNDE